MKAEELKKIQEPFKSKYRNDPSTALVTLRTKAKPGEGITCKVETGKGLSEAGLHTASGGDGLALCSGDMLLEALAACAGVTLRAVATAIDFELKDAVIYVEGDLDFRGTLAVEKTAPVGFKTIRLKFEIQSNEPAEKLSNLIRLTERYCVVYQTLLGQNNIEVSVA